MIEKMNSKWLPLATASILGQAPRIQLPVDNFPLPELRFFSQRVIRI